MTLKLTRLDGKKLAAAVAKALADVQRADDSLAELISLLTPDTRKGVPRGRLGFDGALPGLITVARKRPEIAKRAPRFNIAAVQEDLNNVKTLEPIALAAETLVQRISDGKLLWTGEAWEPSLELYTEAAKEEADGEVQKLIAPMRAAITAGRKPAMTETEKAALKEQKKKEKKIAKAKKVLADAGETDK